MLTKQCNCFDSILVERLFSAEAHIGCSWYKTAYPPLQFAATPGELIMFLFDCLFFAWFLKSSFKLVVAYQARSHLRLQQHEVFTSISFSFWMK